MLLRVRERESERERETGKIIKRKSHATGNWVILLTICNSVIATATAIAAAADANAIMMLIFYDYFWC